MKEKCFIFLVGMIFLLSLCAQVIECHSHHHREHHRRQAHENHESDFGGKFKRKLDPEIALAANSGPHSPPPLHSKHHLKPGLDAGAGTITTGMTTEKITTVKAATENATETTTEKITTEETTTTSTTATEVVTNLTDSSIGTSYSSAYGEEEESAEIAVPRKPKILGATREDIEVTKGDRLELSCNVTGTPTPKVIWIKNDKSELVTKKKNVTSVENTDEFLLTLESVRCEDRGEYDCVSANFLGRASKEFQVTVHNCSKPESTPPVRNQDQDKIKADVHKRRVEIQYRESRRTNNNYFYQ